MAENNRINMSANELKEKKYKEAKESQGKAETIKEQISTLKAILKQYENYANSSKEISKYNKESGFKNVGEAREKLKNLQAQLRKQNQETRRLKAEFNSYRQAFKEASFQVKEDSANGNALKQRQKNIAKRNQAEKNRIAEMHVAASKKAAELGNDVEWKELRDSKGNRIFTFSKKDNQEEKYLGVMTAKKSQSLGDYMEAESKEMQDLIKQAVAEEAKKKSDFEPIIDAMSKQHELDRQLKQDRENRLAMANKAMEELRNSSAEFTDKFTRAPEMSEFRKIKLTPTIRLIPKTRHNGEPSKRHFEAIELTDADGKVFRLTKKMFQDYIKHDRIGATRNEMVGYSWDNYVEAAKKGQLKPETVASFFNNQVDLGENQTNDETKSNQAIKSINERMKDIAGKLKEVLPGVKVETVKNLEKNTTKKMPEITLQEGDMPILTSTEENKTAKVNISDLAKGLNTNKQPEFPDINNINIHVPESNEFKAQVQEAKNKIVEELKTNTQPVVKNDRQPLVAQQDNGAKSLGNHFAVKETEVKAQTDNGAKDLGNHFAVKETKVEAEVPAQKVTDQPQTGGIVPDQKKTQAQTWVTTPDNVSYSFDSGKISFQKPYSALSPVYERHIDHLVPKYDGNKQIYDSKSSNAAYKDGNQYRCGNSVGNNAHAATDMERKNLKEIVRRNIVYNDLKRKEAKDSLNKAEKEFMKDHEESLKKYGLNRCKYGVLEYEKCPESQYNKPAHIYAEKLEINIQRGLTKSKTETTRQTSVSPNTLGRVSFTIE